ncbi:MAG: NAD(+) kinase [Verrucomicrobia bacterium]|nr:MAG: NAD(+) kinase [Verrucomicrobiota bacterium]
MKPIKKLTFFINLQKHGAQDLSEELAKVATSIGTECIICSDHSALKKALQGQDACCVIGGDGTILSTVPECLQNDVPVFGINQGKLGFLATYSPKTVLRHFTSILQGEYQLEERFVLECTTAFGNKALALNDVVIKHYAPSRLMEMDVYCNDHFVTSYACDGLIISTPTGSTAYNLSAGGPIIYPDANVFAMTPICPHTLSNRSVIFECNSTLKINTIENHYYGTEYQSQISLDGQIPWSEHFNSKNLFPIQVSIYDKKVSLIQPMDYSYFKILRKKLKWGDEH